MVKQEVKIGQEGDLPTRVLGFSGGEQVIGSVKPFDLKGYRQLVDDLLNKRDGKVSVGSGEMAHLYHWGAGETMKVVEDARLEVQRHVIWAEAHKRQHEKLSKKFQPTEIVVIGVAKNADQLKTILDRYPESKVKVIELDGGKKAGAEESLRKTHLEDVESGRVEIIEGNAIEELVKMENVGMVEADKVLIHQVKGQRDGLIAAAHKALKPGGVFHVLDILAGRWKASSKENHKENLKTKKAVEVLNTTIPIILSGAWGRCREEHWTILEHLDGEILSAEGQNFVPLGNYSGVYEPLPTGPDMPEAFVSLLVAITPAHVKEHMANIQEDSGLRAKFKNDAKELRLVAQVFVNASNIEGVNLHLPAIGCRVYQKPYEAHQPS
ncbi:MAG: hypothetical protein ABIC96_04450 [Patescibacteria group bacterium]